MEWLTTFLADEDRTTTLLEESGAMEAARVRRALTTRLAAAAHAHLHEQLTLEAAAGETGQCVETMRRRVRRGDVAATKAGRGYLVPRHALTNTDAVVSLLHDVITPKKPRRAR